MTRVIATLEIEGDRLVLRSETGEELAVVNERPLLPIDDLGDRVIAHVVEEMNSVEGNPSADR